MTHNLKDYKEARHYLPHLNAILHVINLSIKGLDHFKCYIPVAKILVTMKEQKTFLELHQVRYKRILETKGKNE